MFHRCSTKEEAKVLFRKLAKKLHPDHGGDSELMLLLKESHETFLEIIGELKKAPYRNNENKCKCKYERVYEDVYIGDKALCIIEDIYGYAEKHKSFNLKFTDSVFEYLQEKGYLTEGQYNVLFRVYSSFRMWED